MAKHKDKGKKKKKHAADERDPQELIERLRSENEALRARLEKIAELTQDLPGSQDDDDDEPEPGLIVEPDAMKV
jgi:hypothetical protein